MRRKGITKVIGLLIMTVGLLILAYPTISDMWNQNHASKLIDDYEIYVDDMSDDLYEEYYIDAEEYNNNLVNDVSRFEPTEESHEKYMSLLDITGTGIMCYVEIPKIEVLLPVYHTTEDSVLQTALGHIEGSSLPIGGSSTHSAISGHTGMVSAKLLTSLDKIEIGDQFYIHILKQSRLYKVDRIDIVLPEETELLDIVPDEDYCTLITCTPYGVNSHRLLVRGKFIEVIEEDKAEEVNIIENTTENKTSKTFNDISIIIILIIILLILIIRYIRGRKSD